jgi:hypothetical protein
MLDLDRILKELEGERDRLDRAIALLRGMKSPRGARKTAASSTTIKPRRRGLTTAGRKRLSEMMKKRWAERRKKASKG